MRSTWPFFILCVALVSAQECELPQLHCFDATCGLDVEGMELKSCPCTSDDYGTEYSACDESTNTRSIIYFWKPPATCRGGVPLPEPIHGIPCDQRCAAGQRVQLTPPFNCVNCTGGQFSAMGGVVFQKPWTVVPAQFTTECIGRGGPCSPWRVQGMYMDSGDNFDVHSIQSLLTLQFELVVPGKISFDYRYDAEVNYDRFAFADEGTALFVSSRKTPDWVTLTFPLDVGHHVVRWFYNKDGAVSRGEDKIFIRKVEVQGLNYGDTECQTCPAGTYSKPGWESCVDCPANFYSGAGAEECLPCEADESSFPGSDHCTQRLPCNFSDMAVLKGPCEAGRRTVTYEWLQEQQCDAAAGVDLPPATTEACNDEGCHPGMALSGSPPTCRYCSPNTASAGGGEPCVPCEAGHAAINRMRYYDTWAPSGEWSTSCVGDCGTDGWRYGGSFADSGAAHGPDTQSSFTLTTSILRPAVLHFHAAVACPPGSAVLQVFLEDSIVAEYPCGGCGAEAEAHVINVPESPFADMAVVRSLTFTYNKVSAPVADHACDYARLYSLAITGMQSPEGASMCNECLPGTSAAIDGSCIECPPGSFSTAGASECAECGNNEITLHAGSSECLACGAYTHANEDHTACTNDACAFNITQASLENPRLWHFSLAALRDKTGGILGPIISPQNASHVFYFSICGPFPVNHTCGSLLEDSEWSDAQGRHNDLHGMHTMPSFACVVRDGEKVASLGAIQAFTPAEEATSEPSFRWELTHGSTFGPALRRSATVHFACDATAGGGAPVVLQADDAAHAEFEWRSIFACPLCSEVDMTSYTDECADDGTQTKHYIFHEPKMCHDGQSLPESESMECTYQLVDKKAVVLKPVFLATIVVLCVALVVAGIAIIVIQWRKHQRLYAEYSRLQMNVQEMAGFEEDFDANTPAGEREPARA